MSPPENLAAPGSPPKGAKHLGRPGVFLESAGAGTAKGGWAGLQAAFATRTRREKLILFAAAFAMVFLLSDNLWLTPSFNRLKAEKAALDARQAEISRVAAQTAALAEQNRQRDAQRVSALATARHEVGDVSAQLAEFERTLVPARRMADFLRGLMPGSGVEMIALKTLPPAPLVQRDNKGAGASRAGDARAANLYKHGVEITLSGSYPALLDYLARLEASPQKVLWGRLDLKVEKHPKTELKLVLYTLSLDPAWLAV